MQDLCTEANRLMKEHRKKGNLRIIIMGCNSSINPTVLEGAPIECLKRERESLVADLCDKVLGQALALGDGRLEHHAGADPFTVEAFGRAVGLLQAALRHCVAETWKE